jgi:predicted membrane-bound mannosyltransferase/DNA-binding beta-propeller fold protein YncE
MESQNSPSTPWLAQPLSRFLPEFNLETLLITVILLFAVISRFYNVDLRVMSHDEVNHVVPSWDLFQGKGYRHDPVTHGPLQFHMIALSYFMLGDNDFSSRLPAVLCSIATVAVVLLGYRRYLGRSGAMIAGFLVLISPYMLFYGRYTRNEALVGLFGALMIYAVLRYLDHGDSTSMVLLTAVTAFHYTSKETSYIYSAQLLLFLAFVFLDKIVRTEWGNHGARNRFITLMAVAILLVGIALGMGVLEASSVEVVSEEAGAIAPEIVNPGLSPQLTGELTALILAVLAGSIALFFLIRDLGWEKIRSLRSFDLLIVQGSLILPLLAAFPVKIIGNALGAGWDPLDYSPEGMVPTAIAIILCTAIAAAIGLWWNIRSWLVNAAVFYTIFAIFYTTFFTNGQGFFTGLIGSLGYWLSQQGVERGSQPLYYYALIQIPIYEYLPALGSLLALYFGFRYRRFSTIPGFSPASTDAVDSDTISTEKPDQNAPSRHLPVLILLLYWSITSLIAYSIAGERMPWLTFHIALPLILCAGWGFGFLVDSTPWKKLRDNRSLIAILLLPVFITSLFSFIGNLAGNSPPFQGKELENLQATSLFLLSTVSMLLSGWGIVYLLKGWLPREISRLLSLTLFALLALLTGRAAYIASYINYDNAKEYLVYAHAARGPKDVLEQVAEVSQRTTGGKDIVVAYDNDGLYPYWWYLRDYPNHRWFTDKPTRDLREVPMIISGEGNFSKLDSIVKDNFVQFDYMRLWWPNQDYFDLTWERVANAFNDPQMRNALFQIWLNRDYTSYAEVTGNKSLTLETWQPSSRMRLYVRKDIVAQIWNYGATPALPTEVEIDPYEGKIVDRIPGLAFGFFGIEQGQFNAPRGAAAAPDGSLYVADSRNHRIQHFTKSGELLNSWGSYGDANAGQAAGGLFNEPWDVTVGPDGDVYVADTWNHRVQKFTADGQFITMWGYYGTGETIEAMWGPRSIAVDNQGTVFVTDTGNKRVVVFDQDGNAITEFGSAGMEMGDLDEPVGIALDKDGNIYIADTWNLRVQVFGRGSGEHDYIPLRAWDVDGWLGQSLENKPYITVDGERGYVFVTDPDGYRILQFDLEGNFIEGWGDYSPDTDGFGLPSGISAGPSGGLWVSDSANNRLLYFEIQSQ